MSKFTTMNPLPGHFEIEDGERGITFLKLLAPWLKGATEIIVVDRYIIKGHQVRLLKEFLAMLGTISENRVSVQIITTQPEKKEAREKQGILLDGIVGETTSGIEVELKFDDSNTMHGRHIVSNSGWKILLDRGLDIYHRPDESGSQEETRPQALRFAKKSDITYVATETLAKYGDSVIKGKVLTIEADQAIIDVGYRMEVRVDLKEFSNPGKAPEIAPGDEVEIYLDPAKNAESGLVISRDTVRSEEALDRLEKAHADEQHLEGMIVDSTMNPFPGHFEIEDGERGITFLKLLAHWLKGATEIIVVDPYIIKGHQVRLLKEFLAMLGTISENRVSVQVITTRPEEEEAREKQRILLDGIIGEIASGIEFKLKFDDPNTMHGRHIVSNSGWKILLDRGLDIYHRPGAAKKSDITYVATETLAKFRGFMEANFKSLARYGDFVIKGNVLAIEADQVIIDVGCKLEGRVDLKEFSSPGKAPEIAPGDEVEVFLDAVKNAEGELVISRDTVRSEEAWDRLEKAYADEQHVEGMIVNCTKGGFDVDLSGVVAFLPRSQVDVRPVGDAGPLKGLKQPFKILKMDRRISNIVVSHRTYLEEQRAKQRAEIFGNLSEGQIVEGVVKKIVEYGAFVDLGDVDGLLHVTDMAWRRVNHPSEILTTSETIKVQVIKINKETHRISLGMKQLQDDPWDLVAAKYPLKSVHRGVVTNITDYGAFVELEAGVEGLVHMAEMSWTKKNVHPGKIVSTSQEVDVMVLEIDGAKRRVSLSLKQTQHNPWAVFIETHPEGGLLIYFQK